MASRTSPLAIPSALALALASIVAAGCSSSAGALLAGMAGGAEAAVLAPGSSSPFAASTDAATGALFTHRAGYAMELPATWIAGDISPAELDQLLVAVESDDVDLGRDMREQLADAGVRVSMVGADPTSDAPVPPLVTVLSLPTQGLRPGQVTARIGEILAALPGLDGEVARSEDPLPTGDTIRFDLRLESEATGPVVVRCHLLRFGGHAYIVAVASSESMAGEMAPVFDAILESLRFGV